MTFRQRLLIIVAILCSVGTLAGCDQQAQFEKLIPKQEAAVGQRLLSDVIGRRFADTESVLDPTIQSTSTQRSLEQLATLFPDDPPKNVHVVGAYTNTLNSVTTYNLTYEYEYPNAWVLANVVLRRQDGQLRAIGIHAQPEKQSLREANRFTFAGKSPLHYVVLMLTASILLLIVYALVLCLRTPITKRKWLWALFVTLGFVQFFFNWTDGSYQLQPISVALLGVGFIQAGPYAPIVLKFSIPVGAIVFLWRRKSLAARIISS